MRTSPWRAAYSSFRFQRRFPHRCFGPVQRGLGVDEGILVLYDGLILNGQPFAQKGELRGQPLYAGVHVLDARCCQLKLALRQPDLLAKGGDRGTAFVDGFSGSSPIRLCQTQGLVALGNLRLRVFHARLS